MSMTMLAVIISARLRHRASVARFRLRIDFWAECDSQEASLGGVHLTSGYTTVVLQEKCHLCVAGMT